MRFDLARMLSAIRDGSIFPSFALDGKINPSPFMHGVRTSLNVQNVFDREYVSDCNYAFGCYYGQERVASVELTYDW